ncbi:MAG TPA: OmpA family protein [Kofleriaceae bacterium]|nr:OmpA family protein [Kofleriaceae bacterium]
MQRVLFVVIAACASRTPPRGLQLQRVILYQNGIGYFERSGHVEGERLGLHLARGELDDVLKTLTVIDRLGAGVATVDVPTAQGPSLELGVRMAAGRVHDLDVGYAVPTPTWKAAYRVVLDDRSSLLQGWAMIANASQDDWDGVQLTLATGAPMSLALDLHTPQFVARPDATGRLVTPTSTGVIGGETATATDRDGDGVVDAVDKCPDEPGPDDGDGCPDHQHAIVATTDSALVVLEAITFAKGGDTLAAATGPTLDAVAATLRANAEIEKVDIDGHASGDENDPWGLSARRAAAVRSALVQRGIAGSRLVVVPYGATRPLDARPGDRDRRVEFVIVQRAAVAPSPARPAPPRYDPETARTAVHAATKPASVAGAVRFVLAEPITIRRGASAMVSILNKPVSAQDALLFRPDAGAPGSDRHPFRAVRLVNDTGYSLEPGPLAIFARGAFVGDSLIDRLDIGATAWVPYALEAGTSVAVAHEDDERPIRIVSIHRGAIEVERADVRVTRYTVAAGRDATRVVYVRHAKRDGYSVRELPPGAIDQGDAYLVPLPLQAGKTSVLAIEERAPRRRTLQLVDADAPELGLYVEGSHLPAAVAERIKAALALRTELGAIDEARERARERIGELAERAEEVRENLRAIDPRVIESSGPRAAARWVRGTDDLRKKLVADLAQATADADALARELATANEKSAATRGRLADALRDLELE